MPRGDSLGTFVLLLGLLSVNSFSPCARTGTLSGSRPAARISAQQNSGIEGLFDEAKARFWRELQKGAGQELDPLPSELKNAPPVVPLADASPLPDSFEDSILLAARTCREALDDGSGRLVIEFDTSAGDETYNLLSRTNNFVKPFLPQLAALLAPPTIDGAAASPARMQVLFPDEGTSAYVAKNWELPPNTITGSMPRAKLADDVDALLLVAPCATEVPAVQRLIAELDETSPTTALFMFNPKLVDMQSTGYGLVGRDLRNMVEQSFLQCFVLKSYPTGALYRLYPEGYSVWREERGAEGGYVLAYNGLRRPSGDELEELMVGEDDGEGSGEGGDFLGGLSRFIKGFQAM